MDEDVLRPQNFCDDGIDDTQQANRHLVQASGAVRGMLVGVFRTITRPAQMKVIIWLAKRKWREATAQTKAQPHTRADGSALKQMRSLHLAPLLVEGMIGAAMYDVYGKTFAEIEARGGVPGAGGLGVQVYADTFGAGLVAGAFCSALNTPHNNILKNSDTTKSLLHSFERGKITLSGRNSVFAGMRHTLPRDSFSTGVLFATNTWFKRNLPQPNEASFAMGAFHAFVSGGLAGACSTIAALPFVRASEWTSQYVLCLISFTPFFFFFLQEAL